MTHYYKLAFLKLHLFFIFKKMFILRERQRGRERETERERIPSMLCAVSPEPDVRLELTNREATT